MKFSRMTADEKRERIMEAIETGEIPPSQYDKLAHMLGIIKVEQLCTKSPF